VFFYVWEIEMPAPGAPAIQLRPWPTQNSIHYWWGTSNPSDNVITNLLRVTDSNAYNQTFTLSPAIINYQVTGLTSNVQYSGFLQASNADGVGPASVFRQVFTGGSPAALTSVMASNLTANSVQLNWTPAAANGAPIGWYVITDLARNLRYNTLGNASNITVPYISGSNMFSVAAVSDPGYSAPTTIDVTGGFTPIPPPVNLLPG